MQRNQLNLGFTLVEVLISALILFAAVTTTSLIYKTSMLATKTAVHQYKINSYLPLIMDEIEMDMRTQYTVSLNAINGQSSVMGFDYDWTAKLLDRAAAPESGLDNSFGAALNPARFSLWEVTVSINTPEKVSSFVYREVTYQ